MKTFKQFISESNNIKVVPQRRHGAPPTDVDSAKHDVHIGGKHVASIYHHPNKEWEVMKPHSNEEWEENYGDNHHDYKTHPENYKTKNDAVAAVVKHHTK